MHAVPDAPRSRWRGARRSASSVARWPRAEAECGPRSRRQQQQQPGDEYDQHHAMVAVVERGRAVARRPQTYQEACDREEMRGERHGPGPGPAQDGGVQRHHEDDASQSLHNASGDEDGLDEDRSAQREAHADEMHDPGYDYNDTADTE